MPPAAEKRYWQRYIYLWMNYALWEELEAEDNDRAREVYRAALKLIPHAHFTFAKVRLLAHMLLCASNQWMAFSQRTHLQFCHDCRIADLMCR